MARIPAIYPNANKVVEPNILGVGKFIGAQPMGVTVHHAADRNLDRVIGQMHKTTIGYHIIIDRDGSVIQTAYLDSKVNHAGKAEWNSKSPNRFHAAVALLGWGDVSKRKEELKPEEEEYFITWANSKIPATDVAHRRGNLTKESFYWDQATPLQLEALEKLLLWFIALGISTRDICGHDECALPLGRKVDPGGTLPLTMSDYRVYLEGRKTK